MHSSVFIETQFCNHIATLFCDVHKIRWMINMNVMWKHELLTPFEATIQIYHVVWRTMNLSNFLKSSSVFELMKNKF